MTAAIQKPIIVWHRRDLRVADNAALYHADKDGLAIPVFIIDPFFFRENNETNPDRIIFMLECLKDLDAHYKRIGSKLLILYGDSVEVITNFAQKLSAKVYFNHDTNMPFGFERDAKVKMFSQFRGFNNDGIIRTKYSANEWAEYCNSYFQSSQFSTPTNLKKHGFASTITCDDVIAKYNIVAEKKYPYTGGYSYAKKRLIEFGIFLRKYPGSLSKPYLAEKYTSRLSAYFSFGAISLREVYDYINNLDQPSKTKLFYITRLFWHQHFTQRMQNFPKLTTHCINPSYELKFDELYEHNDEFINAWKEGRTGYPLIDASMRALVMTGHISFRMRAMVASFFVYNLRQHWKIGADFMHYHLIDADTAINYAQWQMQAGFISQHPIRLYNPTKQIEDNDKDCLFIKKYVPQTRDLPIDFLKRDPNTTQQTLFGYSYIPPIVNFDATAKWARTFYTNMRK